MNPIIPNITAISLPKYESVSDLELCLSIYAQAWPTVDKS